MSHDPPGEDESFPLAPESLQRRRSHHFTRLSTRSASCSNRGDAGSATTRLHERQVKGGARVFRELADRGTGCLGVVSMHVLLDTHALLWWLSDDPALPQSVRKVIAEMQVSRSLF